MHWITEPGTSIPEERRIVITRAARSCATSPACATSARTSARRSSARRSRASNFGENWISIDPNADYDKTIARAPGGRRRLPGPVPQRADLPARADRRGPGRRERADRRAHLRRRPRASCARPPTEVQHAIADVPGIDELHTCSCRTTCRRSRSRVKLDGRRAATASSRATSAAPPATLVASEEVGDIFQRRQVPTTCTSGAPRRRAAASTAIRNLPIDTPSGGHVRAGDVADVAIRPTPNVIERENASRRIDVGADCPTGRDLGAVTERHRGPARRQ